MSFPSIRLDDGVIGVFYLGGCDAEGFFRITRFGGIQPARVMGATTGIGAERRTARKPLPKRPARQGLTPPADATLVPRQARGEQVARDPGTARTEVGRECIIDVPRAVH